MTFSFLPTWLTGAAAPVSETTRQQADAGDAEAQFFMGLKCACGQGLAQDYTEAAVWYTRAAEQNHSLAQFNLAMMFGQGQGGLRDMVKSLSWMKKSAELGDAGAQYNLGLQQHLVSRPSGGEASKEGRIEALKWVQLSAAQGYRGADGACEFMALAMTREEVAEGARRAASFVAGEKT